MLIRKSQLIGDEILTKQKLKQITYWLREKENITTLWLPGGGRTTTAIKFQNNPIFNKVSKFRKYDCIKCFYLDLNISNLQIENYINEILSQKSKERGIRSKIQSIINEGNYVYFVLDNINTSTIENLRYILNLRSINNNKVKFINLFLAKDFLSIREINTMLPSSLFHNILLIPYMDKQTALEWIKYTSRKMRTRLNEKERQAIYNFCGGIPLILKNAIRSIKTNKNLKASLTGIQMQNIVNTFWGNLSIREKEILTKASKKQPLPNYPKEIHYLKDLNLLNRDNSFDKGWIRLIEAV